MTGSTADRTMRVMWRDGLWRAIIIDAKHPEGVEAAKSPDDVIFDWARQYGAAHRLSVEVDEETRPLLTRPLLT